jgi:pyridinium-3,5-biscarboxylic acid mononucleotide sulfurtransferase
LGFRIVRVRDHGGIARIEVPVEDLPRMVARGMSEKVVQAVREAGFVYVTIDLRGYRSGSMNEDLPRRDRSP